MSDGAPRITAGYDADAPREMVFPSADRDVNRDPGAGDPVALAVALAAGLTALCGVTVIVTPLAGGGDKCAWSVDASGASWGFGGGHGLAAALLARQCGGPFEAAGAAGSPQVERCRTELSERLRAVLLPGGEDWTIVDSGPVAATGFAVDAGGLTDRIDIALVRATPATDHGDSDDWRRRLAQLVGTLAVPVRLVLHDGRIAVRAARALGVGDVLPIAAAHEVGLRVGGFAWARGHVEDEAGAPRIRIVARAARPLLKEPA